MTYELLTKQYRAEVERLECRIAELIKERDEYDARRREAMAKVEEWRQKYWELEARCKYIFVDNPSRSASDLAFYRTQYRSVPDQLFDRFEELIKNERKKNDRRKRNQNDGHADDDQDR